MPVFRVHTITSKYVVALPTTLPEPSAYSLRNVFVKGVAVLALYPGTTRFVRGTVMSCPGEPPSGRRSYIVAFEQADLEPGLAATVAVPPAFVVELPACLNES